MATESKKTIYEASDILVKNEDYTEDSARQAPRDRMSERIPGSRKPTVIDDR